MLTKLNFARDAARIFFLPLIAAMIACGGGHGSTSSTNPASTENVAIAFPLRTSGRFIVDANGRRVRLKAFNWYGAEGPDAVVGGLAYQPLDPIASELHGWGFNAVRLLWSNRNYEQNPVVTAGAVAANPDLVGLHFLDAFDRVIASLAANHLMVILDNHVSDPIWCCSETDGDGLWYNDAFPESSWTSDWQAMAARYAGQPDVVGADLRNELRCATLGGQQLCTTWGGAAATDWHAAAERGGNAVLAANSNLLIFVEGTSYATDLSQAGALPVVLNVPDRLVYEAHDYGFDYASNPLASYDDWISRITPRWGYITTGPNPQPLWLGEFGTCNTADSCVESTKNTELGFWFQIVSHYIQTNSLDWCYWPANGTYSNYPNAGKNYGDVETYGILNTVWTGASRASLLSGLQALMP